MRTFIAWGLASVLGCVVIFQAVRQLPATAPPDLLGAGNYSLQTVDGNLRPVGYRQLTDLAAATSLPYVSGAELVLIQAETQTLRIRDDGTAPTADVGLQLFASDSLWYNADDLTKAQLIEVAASGKANLLFYAYE